MGIFKKVAKKAAKTVSKGAKTVGKSASQTFKGTVGKGARKTPTLKQVLGVAKRYNPYVGIRDVTRALNRPAPQRRRRPRRR